MSHRRLAEESARIAAPASHLVEGRREGGPARIGEDAVGEFREGVVEGGGVVAALGGRERRAVLVEAGQRGGGGRW